MSVWLQNTYERLFDDGSGAMKLKRGKIHEYLGMQLDFTVAGQLKITMFDYIQEISSTQVKLSPVHLKQTIFSRYEMINRNSTNRKLRPTKLSPQKPDLLRNEPGRTLTHLLPF